MSAIGDKLKGTGSSIGNKLNSGGSNYEQTKRVLNKMAQDEVAKSQTQTQSSISTTPTTAILSGIPKIKPNTIPINVSITFSR